MEHCTAQGRDSTSVRKVGARKRGIKVGEGDHHKLNISCLMYHLLIQFFTGEKTGMVKRTHKPPTCLPFHVDVAMVEEVDLFREIGFDCKSYLLCISVPCMTNIDSVCSYSQITQTELPVSTYIVRQHYDFLTFESLKCKTDMYINKR